MSLRCRTNKEEPIGVWEIARKHAQPLSHHPTRPARMPPAATGQTCVLKVLFCLPSSTCCWWHGRATPASRQKGGERACTPMGKMLRAPFPACSHGLEMLLSQPGGRRVPVPPTTSPSSRAAKCACSMLPSCNASMLFWGEAEINRHSMQVISYTR